jgi:hypothetical protein
MLYVYDYKPVGIPHHGVFNPIVRFNQSVEHARFLPGKGSFAKANWEPAGGENRTG